MVKTTWSHLWKWHHQAIDLLRFSVGMDARNGKKEGGEGETSRLDGPPPSYTRRQQVGLVLGPALFIVTLFFLSPQGMSYEAKAVLASTLWIATWWITEAIPIPATSLLPIVLFPLTGALASGDTTAAYGDPTIFLFMGGFMLALAMERWNLHKRIALNIISLVGTSTERIVLGTMVATGFLSMWISNSATAMMMMPIGLAIIYQIAESLKEDGGKEFKVLIKGHTDSKGSDAYNMKLSQRRAEAVRKALVDRFGVPASMLTAKGYGEREPLVPNDTESNRQKNRRVEFVVEPK
ncbi:MAG: anion permease [Planifilum fulgidum]